MGGADDPVGSSSRAMLTGLTPLMLRLLEYVQDEIERTGICPTYKEIARAIGVSSPGNVNRLVGLLIERGYMTKINATARSLTILRPAPSAFRRALERIAAGAQDPQAIAAAALQKGQQR